MGLEAFPLDESFFIDLCFALKLNLEDLTFFIVQHQFIIELVFQTLDLDISDKQFEGTSF